MNTNGLVQMGGREHGKKKKFNFRGILELFFGFWLRRGEEVQAVATTGKTEFQGGKAEPEQIPKKKNPEKKKKKKKKKTKRKPETTQGDINGGTGRPGQK